MFTFLAFKTLLKALDVALTRKTSKVSFESKVDNVFKTESTVQFAERYECGDYYFAEVMFIATYL